MSILLKGCVKAQMVYKEAQEAFFSKKMMPTLLVMFGIAVLFVIPDTMMAANPLSVMKEVYIEQAEENAFPVIILWTLVLGIVISFAMGKFMPFILAVIASVIIAVTPELAPNFDSTNITPSSGW